RPDLTAAAQFPALAGPPRLQPGRTAPKQLAVPRPTNAMNTLARILPVFTALAIAAIAAVFSAGLLVRLTEARSLADVTAVLRLSGFEWARVTVDGLQVRLSGQAPSEALRFRALSAAGTVVDAARVIDEIAVAEKVFEPPRFSIEIL